MEKDKQKAGMDLAGVKKQKNCCKQELEINFVSSMFLHVKFRFLI